MSRIEPTPKSRKGDMAPLILYAIGSLFFLAGSLVSILRMVK